MKSTSYCVDIIREYLKKEKLIDTDNLSFSKISNIFSYIAKMDNFNNLYLRNYIYSNICSYDVMKRKTSARDFEDFLASLLDGAVTDEKNRKNDIKHQLENEFISKWASSNHREKIDISFKNNSYALSVKTLIKGNAEINMGAFEKTALFYNLDVEDYLLERKSKNTLGLGSIPQLTQLLKLIESNNQYDIFYKRFIEMSSVIFAHDILLLIKDDINSQLFLITKEKFLDKLAQIAKSPEEFTSLINRWEGNSIRMRVSGFREISDIIDLNLDFSENKLIQTISNFEFKINELIINFANESLSERVLIKNKILTHTEELFAVIEEYCR